MNAHVPASPSRTSVGDVVRAVGCAGVGATASVGDADAPACAEATLSGERRVRRRGVNQRVPASPTASPSDAPTAGPTGVARDPQ
jgi:hypothetical protein